MLIRDLALLLRDPGAFLALLVAVVVGLLVAITVHEASHAFMAYRLGDDTARRLGRLTLNPLAHLDPVGTAMLFVVGFGWGKPVPVNPFLLRTHPRRGMAQVAVAGPLANLATVALVAIPIKLGLLAWHSPFYYLPFSQREPAWLLADIFGYIVFFNVILALFNLIPVPPLDGYNVVQGLVPQRWSASFSRLAPYGPVLLLAVVLIDIIFNTGFLWRLLGPAVNAVGALLVGRPLF